MHNRNLVVAAFGDQLLARRYNETEIHPNIAVLTGQSVDPSALAPPVIAPLEKVTPRKIVGTLFASHRLPLPANDENAEFVPLTDFSVLKGLIDQASLFKVDGRSAEPIALDGQFIITQPVTVSTATLHEMNGRLVIAVDDGGTRYFKRLRVRDAVIILESLNPDGTAPAEILSIDGALGLPCLAGLLEVVGVLFELPNST